LKPFQVGDKSDPRDPESNLATPDVDYHYGGYPKTTTYNTDEIYIPMKVFPFNTYIEIAEKARTDYGSVQQSSVFRDGAISEEQIVDDIVSSDPSKSNKLILLSEAGNGKSTMARRMLALCGEKYPDVSLKALEG